MSIRPAARRSLGSLASVLSSPHPALPWPQRTPDAPPKVPSWPSPLCWPPGLALRPQIQLRTPLPWTQLPTLLLKKVIWALEAASWLNHSARLGPGAQGIARPWGKSGADSRLSQGCGMQATGWEQGLRDPGLRAGRVGGPGYSCFPCLLEHCPPELGQERQGGTSALQTGLCPTLTQQATLTGSWRAWEVFSARKMTEQSQRTPSNSRPDFSPGLKRRPGEAQLLWRKAGVRGARPITPRNPQARADQCRSGHWRRLQPPRSCPWVHWGGGRSRSILGPGVPLPACHLASQ